MRVLIDFIVINIFLIIIMLLCLSVSPSAAAGFVPAWGNWPNDQTNAWYTDDSEWLPLADFTFTTFENSYVDLRYSDNVGIYGFNWCTLGIFLDDSLVPLVIGAYSGNADSTVFNSVTLHAETQIEVPGLHVLHVRHRSQYCHYGNSPISDIPVKTYVVRIYPVQ